MTQKFRRVTPHSDLPPSKQNFLDDGTWPTQLFRFDMYIASRLPRSQLYE